MIQLILNSPFMSQDLELALRYRMEGDLVVLMQDAVMAAAAPGWCERLADVPLYVTEGRPASERLVIRDRDGTRYAGFDQVDRRARITADLGRLGLVFLFISVA